MAENFAVNDFAAIAQAMKGQPADPVQTQELIRGDDIDWSVLLPMTKTEGCLRLPKWTDSTMPQWIMDLAYPVSSPSLSEKAKDNILALPVIPQELIEDDKGDHDILTELEFQVRYREDADAPDTEPGPRWCDPDSWVAAAGSSAAEEPARPDPWG